MKVTLEQLRNQIAGVATNDDYMLQGWIAAIDAHLAQPAQPVDVSKIPDAKPLPDLMMASYHEAIGWNAYREAMLNAALQENGNG